MIFGNKKKQMELRGQDKDLGINQNSLYFNQPQPNNQESKLSSISTDHRTRNEAGQSQAQAQASTILNQTLDHSHLLHHHHHQLNPHQQQTTQRPERDSNPNPIPNPDPDPSLVPTTTIAGESSTNPPAPIRFRECLKNHAAAMGGHAVDGCGEFLPGGEEGTPEALKCAACECHRNFHRKEVEGEGHQVGTANNNYYNYSVANRSNTNMSPNTRTHQAQPRGGVMLGFGGATGAPADSSSEDLNNAGGEQASKKRFRTKFSEEQKERMQGFGEKLGWKIQKDHEDQVQEFCDEVGVKRKVFKVWMHNNKQALKRKTL